MKRTAETLFLLFLFFLFLNLSGCERNVSVPADSESAISVVCTAFPQYDWTRAILGEQIQSVNVVLLNRQGSDMHSFQPTAKDMIQMAGCDLFLYIGGFSESWVNSALESAGNNSAIILPLLDAVEKKEEIVTEGMDLGLGGHEKHKGHEEDTEYDEHIWLSLRCAQDACDAICDAVCRLDPANEPVYRQNLEAYKKKLQSLDRLYEEVIRTAKRHLLFVADRFPFRYLADDYHLRYYAAFPGCSAETEASFDTVIFLAEKADSLNLPIVLITEGGDKDFAQTVIDNTENGTAEILALDSMQSVSEKDIRQGTTYLSIMEKNLQVLKRALN